MKHVLLGFEIGGVQHGLHLSRRILFVSTFLASSAAEMCPLVGSLICLMERKGVNGMGLTWADKILYPN